LNKNFTVLHTSDWHIGTYPCREKNGVNERGQDIINCLNYIVEQAEIIQPDIILVAGDIFHQSKTWGDRALKEVISAIEIIDKLSAICPVVISKGTPNHDGREHFNILNTHYLGNNRVYIGDSDDKLYKINTSNNQLVNVVSIPAFDQSIFTKSAGLNKEEIAKVYTQELAERILKLREQCDNSLPSILLTHYTVNGCNSESGQMIFMNEPFISTTTLNKAEFDLVALGHIHRPQQLQNCMNTFYAGCPNQLTFNDEGQKRGFYTYKLDVDRDLTSTFIETPYRQFYTLDLNSSEINDFNNGLDILEKYKDNIKDKIVRVHYNCSNEENKMFNKASFEKKLYDYDIFWMSEISSENITENKSKSKMSDKKDPISNLHYYLEKQNIPEDRIEEIIEVAKPIVESILVQEKTSHLVGIFEPVEIEVKNYRNYLEEKFNFSDIKFCTINGSNGAGKSSLFMDALITCLYEETREKDLVSWINNSEKAKSGSIQFTFKIGTRIFKVSRTRTKSSKGTLNMFEFINDDWQNISKDKMVDTQSLIIDILGMDCQTFKSCALIMQDEYDIFLKTDKENRMSMLSYILGLGIYDKLSKESKEKLTELNRQLKQLNIDIDNLSDNLLDTTQIKNDIISYSNKNTECLEDINKNNEELNKLQIEIAQSQQKQKTIEMINSSIISLQQKEKTLENDITKQNNIIKDCDDILNEEELIHNNISKHNQLIQEEQSLKEQKATYNILLDNLKIIQSNIKNIKSDIEIIYKEKNNNKLELDKCQQILDKEESLKETYNTFKQKEQLILDLEEKEKQHKKISQEINQLTIQLIKNNQIIMLK